MKVQTRNSQQRTFYCLLYSSSLVKKPPPELQVQDLRRRYVLTKRACKFFFPCSLYAVFSSEAGNWFSLCWCKAALYSDFLAMLEAGFLCVTFADAKLDSARIFLHRWCWKLVFYLEPSLTSREGNLCRLNGSWPTKPSFVVQLLRPANLGAGSHQHDFMVPVWVAHFSFSTVG